MYFPTIFEAVHECISIIFLSLEAVFSKPQGCYFIFSRGCYLIFLSLEGKPWAVYISV